MKKKVYEKYLTSTMSPLYLFLEVKEVCKKPLTTETVYDIHILVFRFSIFSKIIDLEYKKETSMGICEVLDEARIFAEDNLIKMYEDKLGGISNE